MTIKLRNFLFWTLETRTSPLAYLVAYSSLAIGFFWTFFLRLSDIRNTLLYKEGLVIGNGSWGIVLFIGSLILMAGLKFKRVQLVKIGAMTNFVMWGFAAFLYACITTGICSLHSQCSTFCAKGISSWLLA